MQVPQGIFANKLEGIAFSSRQDQKSESVDTVDCSRGNSVGDSPCLGGLFSHEVAELEVAIVVGFYPDFVPSHFCHGNAQQALCIDSLVFADQRYFATHVRGNTVEAGYVSAGVQMDFVKVLLIDNHN